MPLNVSTSLIIEANPFHDPEDGKFTSALALANKGKGSYSFQFSGRRELPRRLRTAKIGNRRSDPPGTPPGPLLGWVQAQFPCGRRARMQGIDAKCSEPSRKARATRERGSRARTRTATQRARAQRAAAREGVESPFRRVTESRESSFGASLLQGL